VQVVDVEPRSPRFASSRQLLTKDEADQLRDSLKGLHGQRATVRVSPEQTAPAPAGGHTPGPLQYVERFDARMWPAQSGWGPMTRQDIESIHESLPALRVIVNSHASLLAERDRLKAALEKIDRACQSWVGQTEIQGIARDALAEGGE